MKCDFVFFAVLLQFLQGHCEQPSCNRNGVLETLEAKLDEVLDRVSQLEPCACKDIKSPLTSCLDAYYPFDEDFRDKSGNGRHGQTSGNAAIYTGADVIRGSGAAQFGGSGKVDVDSFRNHAWGSNFGISVWFKRTASSNYQGIVGNGYYTHGSWEIRMGRENSGQMLGGGVITSDSSKTWDYINLVATLNTWHHVVMTYDGKSLFYYLDNQKQQGDAACCSGDMVIKNTPLTIGKAGVGTSTEYFKGFIDELKIFHCALSDDDVEFLYNERKSSV